MLVICPPQSQWTRILGGGAEQRLRFSALEREELLARPWAQGLELVMLDDELTGGTLGVHLIERIRRHDPHVGVIMLLANTLPGASAAARIRGFASGADDCLELWMSWAELVARLEAVQRRTRAAHRPKTGSLRCGTLCVDVSRRTTTVAGNQVFLQPKQQQVLAYLVEHAGRFVSESELLRELWQSHHVERSSVVRVQIHLLRKALGEAGKMIETGREGWRLGASDSGG